jgi:uncharacterized membrane protein YuzA (DUF378 family)
MVQHTQTSKALSFFYLLTDLLIVVGALNWLAVGTTGTDLVTTYLGSSVGNIIFDVVGVSGFIQVILDLFYVKANSHKLGYKIAKLLVVVGAYNWLSIGLYNYDFVKALVGGLSNYVFTLVGLAGLFVGFIDFRKQRLYH